MWHDFYPDQKPVTKSDKPLELCTACDYTFLKEDQEYDHRHRAICPRCASLIEIPESVKLQRVWATLVAGIIMLFPANLLPISGVYLTGSLSQDTLMSGVMSFISMGSYFVAFVVFFASILCQ